MTFVQGSARRCLPKGIIFIVSGIRREKAVTFFSHVSPPISHSNLESYYMKPCTQVHCVLVGYANRISTMYSSHFQQIRQILKTR